MVVFNFVVQALNPRPPVFDQVAIDVNARVSNVGVLNKRSHVKRYVDVDVPEQELVDCIRICVARAHRILLLFSLTGTLDVHHNRHPEVLAEEPDRQPFLCLADGLYADGYALERDDLSVAVQDVLLVQNDLLDGLLYAGVVRDQEILLERLHQIQEGRFLEIPGDPVYFRAVKQPSQFVPLTVVVHQEDVVELLEPDGIIHVQDSVSDMCVGDQNGIRHEIRPQKVDHPVYHRLDIIWLYVVRHLIQCSSSGCQRPA